MQVWDLIKLADYLSNQRDDIDYARIGITGESLGGLLNQFTYLNYDILFDFIETHIIMDLWYLGMHAWFAAFADTRYAVVAPIIGVQVQLVKATSFYF